MNTTLRMRVATRLHCRASSRSIVATSTLHGLQFDLRNKERSAKEICQDYFNRLRDAESKVDSFLYFDEETALEQAARIDQSLVKNGNWKDYPLAGIPIAVKDNICTRGMPTTAGSKALEGFVPTYDATVVERLKAAGAIVMGKTNLDEFGMGNSTEMSAYKATRNPWDLGRVPGGSSGGSAAAVASRQCPAALGSDTGGSIRQPAHFCGCVGIKPSYGRVSRYGLIAYGSSLDTIGPIASTVKDAALVLQVIAGVDARDSTSVDLEVTDYVSTLKPPEDISEKPLEGKKIGLVQEMSGDENDERILRVLMNTVSHIESLGGIVEEVSIKDLKIALAAYYVIACSEASSNLSRYDGVRYGLQHPADDIQSLYKASRMNGLGDEVKRRILIGTHALSAGHYDAFYGRAQYVRTLIAREFNRALMTYDALLLPAAPTLPWKFHAYDSDPLTQLQADVALTGCNMAGLPGISLPLGTAEVEGKLLPIGLQLLGRRFEERALIELAHVVEQTIDLRLPTPTDVTT